MPAAPKKGLGLTLVGGFANQIQGRLEFAKVETGTRIVLYFPVIPGDGEGSDDGDLTSIQR